ncbi:hypothetical protein PIB30_034037 [Stylosanthes scabra]|uniref:Uncharacterized protein n=1 Tax=Stylosanthes scabra TaxID=79078 RepID=A0ABU6XBH1_9FABA|nr:hypothetical protein [Stylosanthes scabra]
MTKAQEHYSIIIANKLSNTWCMMPEILAEFQTSTGKCPGSYQVIKVVTLNPCPSVTKARPWAGAHAESTPQRGLGVVLAWFAGLICWDNAATWSGRGLLLGSRPTVVKTRSERHLRP